jgi:FADH2 O2-dependent halogenase
MIMASDLHQTPASTRPYDVIILGTGLGGGMLGSILAKHDLKVLMIDSDTHPRFTIGEATTPDTNFRLKLLGTKYGVPEIANLSAFHDLRDTVGPSSGIKRAFSFLYQRDGQDQRAKESHQYPTLAPPMGPDAHFFRQDTDAFMMASAVGYGATVRQQTRVQDIQIDDEGVTVTSDRQETFRARYLVDGTGMRSVLANRFDLRVGPERFRTNSRAIYTHMVGVKPYDMVGGSRSEHQHKYPLSQSTLHHVFEGGWFWVIPFNNHADATNPLCSVGLVLNRNVHPETGMDPEEEFWSHVRRFPDMMRHFEGARAVRNWTSTGRLQYGSKTITGPRFCLLAHAGFFIDPLYSTGLALTTAMVDLLSAQLLKSFRTGDFSPEAFEKLNGFFDRNITYADQMVSSSFVSFRDYDLWDAWFRVWVVGLFIGTAVNATIYLKYVETGRQDVLDNSITEPNDMILGGRYPEFQKLFTVALATMDQVRDGQLDPKQGAQQIRGLFKDLPYVPSYWRWSDPEVRTTPAFTLWGMTKMYFWFQLFCPKHLRQPLFDWNSLTAYRYILKAVLKSNRLARQRRSFYTRDVFKAWNMDWKASRAS